MEIFLNVLFLIIGMALLIKGADFFVDGASAVAKKLKVPDMFIGLTIVALGTSLPELSVSIASAIKHSVDLSVGNVVGSNLFNMLFIIGVIAIFKPVYTSTSNKKLDFPFLLLVTALLLLFSADTILNGATSNILSRTESIIFVAILVFYTTILIINAKKEGNTPVFDHPQNAGVENATQKPEPQLKVWQIVLYLILGLAGVVFGAECVCTTSQFLAIKMGMSEALVGLTIVAVGTSLPELTTSIIAAKKGNNDLALGNVLGSNIINISLILGVVGVIGQAAVSNLVLVDIAILFVCTCIFSALSITGGKVTKPKGIILTLMYVAYTAFAIVRNYCF